MDSIIRVFVVDSQPVFCSGIQAVLNTTTNLQLLGTATSLKQDCSWATKKPPDVLLLTTNTSDDYFLESISAWKKEYQDSKVLMVIPNASTMSFRKLTDQGVEGCILKNDTPESFIQAIQSIANGENWFSRELMQDALQTQSLLAQEISLAQLQEQKEFILQLLCAEKCNHEIAMTLHISERTVCRYLEDIYIKLGVNSRVGAAVRAVKMGLA